MSDKQPMKDPEGRLDVLKEAKKVFLWHDGVPNLRAWLDRKINELEADTLVTRAAAQRKEPADDPATQKGANRG